MNQEVVASVDLEAVARADEGGGGAFLDQQRSVECAAGTEIGAVVDRYLAPAVRRIDPDLALFAWLGGCRLRRPHGRRRPVEPAAADDAERGDVDAAAGLDMAEQALVLGFERLAGRAGVEAGPVEGDPHRPLLAVVTQVDFALDRGIGVGKAVAGQRVAGASLELVKARVEGRAVEPVEIGHEHLEIILPHVGLQHAERAERAGGARQQRPAAAQRARHGGAVHRAGAAGGHQGEGRGIVAAFDAEPLDGMQQVLLQQADHAGRGVLDRQAERPGQFVFDGLARQRAVERDGTAGQRAGAQAPEHELRVGDGRLHAAQAVGGGPGPRAGALRADMQQAGIVDPGDGAAARADGVDLDRRRREMVAVDGELIGHRHVASRHHHDVAAGAADLHRDQVGRLARRGTAFQRADAGGGAGQDQHHRTGCHLGDRHRAAIALQQQQRAGQAELAELLVERAEIARHLGRDIGVDHGGRAALVLAHGRHDLARQRDPFAGPAFGQLRADRALVCAVEKAVEQTDGDRFHALGGEHFCRRVDVGCDQRGQFPAVGADPPAHRQAQVARRQDGGKRRAMVPLVVADAAADLE